MSPLLGRPTIDGHTAAIRGFVLLLAIALASQPLGILVRSPDWMTAVAWGAVPVVLVGIVLRQWMRGTVIVPLLQFLTIGGILLGAAAVSGPPAARGSLRALFGVIPDMFVSGLGDLGAGVPPIALAGPSAVMVILGAALLALALDLLFLDLGWHTPTAILLLVLGLLPVLQEPTGGPWLVIAGPVAACLIVLATRTLQADPVYVTGDTRPQARPLRRPVGTTIVTLSVIAIAALGAFPLGARLPALTASTYPLNIDTVNAWRGESNTLPAGTMVDHEVSVRRSLLRRDHTEVLRYRTSDPEPGYLRMQALTRYDAARHLFRSSPNGTREAGELPTFDPKAKAGKAVGLPVGPETRSFTADLRITSLSGGLLPTPGEPATGTLALPDGQKSTLLGDPGTGSVSVLGASPRLQLDGARYRVSSVRLAETEALTTVRREDLALLTADGKQPVKVPPRVEALAEEVVTKAAREQGLNSADDLGPYQTALAFQQYFQREYDYSLNSPTRPGEDPIDSFLDEKIGYCEQFAAVFTLMMHSRGFPTRVAVGYTSGQVTGEERVVTNANAHAWPEVWMGSEYGWVVVDPTPPEGIPGGGAQGAAESEQQIPPEGTSAPQEQEPSAAAEEEPTREEPTGAGQESSSAEPSSSSAAADSGGEQREQSRLGAVLGWVLGAAGLIAAVLLVVLMRRRMRAEQARRYEERWAQAAQDGPGACAELAWVQVVEALARRERRVRWWGWTGRWGSPPVTLRLARGATAEEALLGVVSQARALDSAAQARALDSAAQAGSAGDAAPTAADDRWAEAEQAATRIGQAVTYSRYAPAGVTSAEPPSADTHPLRPEAETLTRIILTRPR